MSQVKGKISQIIGPVIDVNFENADKLPNLLEAIEIIKEDGSKVILECQKRGLILFWLLFEHRAIRITPPLTISKEEIKKLSNTETEEVLTFLLMFDEKVEDLDIPEGNARFRLFERLLSEQVKREWRTIRLDYADQGTGKDIFDQCVSDFTVRFMSEEVVLDTKEWLSEIRKPGVWSMQLLARVKTIKDLFYRYADF